MQKIKGRTSFLLNQYKGFKPLADTNKKESKKPIWQQKYSAPKEVTTEEQLENTIKYIQTNRNKHQLEPHQEILQNLIDTMCCSFDGI